MQNRWRSWAFFGQQASILGTAKKLIMDNSLRSGPTPSGGERKEGGVSPKQKAEQDWQQMAALRQKIADLQARQKETILRLSTQRSPVEEVGVALAELEKELSVAQEQLARFDQKPGLFRQRAA